MGSMEAAQAFQDMEGLWKALDFSWDMSFRVNIIITFVGCTYDYPRYNSNFICRLIHALKSKKSKKQVAYEQVF